MNGMALDSDLDTKLDSFMQKSFLWLLLCKWHYRSFIHFYKKDIVDHKFKSIFYRPFFASVIYSTQILSFLLLKVMIDPQCAGQWSVNRGYASEVNSQRWSSLVKLRESGNWILWKACTALWTSHELHAVVRYMYIIVILLGFWIAATTPCSNSQTHESC